jgi:hypothetical protein
MLDTAVARTDYRSRRQSLRGWVISRAEWSHLTAGLSAHSESRVDW